MEYLRLVRTGKYERILRSIDAVCENDFNFCIEDDDNRFLLRQGQYVLVTEPKRYALEKTEQSMGIRTLLVESALTEIKRRSIEITKGIERSGGCIASAFEVECLCLAIEGVIVRAAEGKIHSTSINAAFGRALTLESKLTHVSIQIKPIRDLIPGSRGYGADVFNVKGFRVMYRQSEKQTNQGLIRLSSLCDSSLTEPLAPVLACFHGA